MGRISADLLGNPRESREKLIVEHLHLVAPIARQLRRRLPWTIPLDDLVAEGNLALVRAADSWDQARGMPFSIWARYIIRGRIIDSVKGRNFIWESHAPLLQDTRPSPDPPPDEGVLLDQQRRLVQRAAARLLTRRERATLRHIVTGATMTAIGRRLRISTMGACVVRNRAVRKIAADSKIRGVTTVWPSAGRTHHQAVIREVDACAASRVQN